MTDYRQHPSIVAHWRDASLQPLPEAQEARETIWFAAPPEPDTEQMWEGLRGRLESDGTATVLGVPAYLFDVNFGDRVSVMRSAENALVATGVENDAINFTFRVQLNSDDPNAWRPLAEELAEKGCLLDFISPRFFAISCGEPQAQDVAVRLSALEHHGVLHYETGRTQQLGQTPDRASARWRILSCITGSQLFPELVRSLRGEVMLRQWRPPAAEQEGAVITHLVEHLEQYLGPISGGWSRDADGRSAHAQVVKFDDGPLDGVVAYSTLGLSRCALAMPGRAPIRIELLMLVRRGHFERYIPSMMQQLAEEMIHEGRAPLRGEVIGPRGPLDPHTRLEAFLVYSPYYQPDGFAVCEDVDGPIIIANLVPLFPAEANFAATYGWEALEGLLVEHDPDVDDWLRPPLPVHNL